MDEVELPPQGAGNPLGVLGFGDYPWSLVWCGSPNMDGMHLDGHMKVVASLTWAVPCLYCSSVSGGMVTWDLGDHWCCHCLLGVHYGQLEAPW